MSYVNKKIRVFKEAGDIEVQRKRSDGRMKSYSSAMDARAWCDSTEERRQYILDLVRQGDGKGLSLGKYIPIEAIIDILLANKNADIKRLLQEIEELKKFIKDNGLHYEEKPLSVIEPVASAAGPYGGGIRTKRSVPGEYGESGEIEYEEGGIPGKESAISGQTGRAGTTDETAESTPFVTDSSDYDTSPDKSPRSREDDEKALTQALAEKEAFYKNEHALAVEAIEQLERIKGIVDGGDSEKKSTSSEPSTTPAGGLKADDSDLRKRLDHLKGLEDEIRKLKKEANKCVEPAGDSADRDKLLARIAELEAEAENCRCKMKEIDILKVEKNCLQMRCDDLCRLQKDYEDLLKKTQGFEAIKAECAMYKAKYEELKDLECECNELRAKVQKAEELEKDRHLLMKEIEDCECCMSSQEDEIKRLACHIDCLTQDLDKRQDDMKVKVLTMRANLEKKDNLIAKSEQQLADVQDQLRNSIENLSCETTCLRTRIEELEDDIMTYKKALAGKDEVYKVLEAKYNSLENSLKKSTDHKRKEESERKDLENTVTRLQESNKALLENLETEKCTNSNLEEALRKAIKSDEHLKQMLKQAKCAIQCITQKLEKHDLIGIGRLEAERENYLKKIKELEKGMGEGQGSCGAERIAELEEELIRCNAANKCLRDSLDQLKGMRDENDTLRRISTQLQETAKDQVTKLADTNETLSRRSHEVEDKCDELRDRVGQMEKMLQEKDDLIEYLRNANESLNKHLDDEKARYEVLQNALENLSASGDEDAAHIGKMKAQINVLNAEIDRLNFDLESQKRECEETIARFKAKMKQLEENDEIIRALEETNDDTTTDASKFQKESQLLRIELNKMKQKRDECESEMSKLRAELAAKTNELNKLKGIQMGTTDEEMERINKDELAARDNLEQENKDLKDQLNKLKQGDETGLLEIIDKLKKQLEEKEKAEKDLKDEINKLKQQLQSGASDALVKENNDLKDEVNKLKQQLQSGDSSGLVKENSDLKDELNKLKQQLQSGASDALVKENNDLKDEVNKLKQQLQSGASDALVKENNDLKDELNKLKQQLESGASDALVKENNDLKDEVNKLKQQLQSGVSDALVKENNDLKDELNKLKQQLQSGASDALVKENNDLKDELNKLKQQMQSGDSADLVKENNDLKDEINKLKQQLQSGASGDLAKENNDLKDELNKQSTTLSNLEKENNDLKEELNKLKQQLQKQQQDSGAVVKDVQQQDVSALEKELNTLRQEASDKKALEDENKNLKDELNKLKQSATDKEVVDSENKKLKDEINKLQQAAAALEDEIKKLKQELSAKDTTAKDDTKDQQFAKEKDDLLNQIAQQKKEIADLLSKIKEPAKTEDTSMFEEMERKSKEMDKLRSTIDDLEKKLKDLENVNKENEKLKAANADLEKKLKDLEDKSKDATEVNKLKATIDDLEKKLKDLENTNKENESLKAANADLEKKLKDLEDKSKDATEMNKLRSTIDDLEKKLKDLENTNEENERLKAANADLEKKLKDLEDKNKDATEVNKLKSTIDDLEKKLKDLENANKENENLKAANADLEKKMKDLENANKENERLKAANADLEKKLKDLEDKNKEGDISTTNDLEKTRRDLENANKEIERLKAANADLEKKLKDSEDKNKEAGTPVSTTDDSEKTRRDLENANKEIERLKAANADLEKKLRDLEDKSKEAGAPTSPTDDSDKTRRDLENANNEIERLKAANADLEKKLRDLDDKNIENATLKANVDNLQKQLNDLRNIELDIPEGSPEIERAVKLLQVSLQQEEEKVRNLEDSLKKCQETNESLKQRIAELEQDQNRASAGEGQKTAAGESKPAEKVDTRPIGDASERVRDLEDQLAKQKQQCNDMIASLKEQYDRDIKNLRQQSEAAINKLQTAHQKSLDKLSQEHEGAADMFKEELRGRESSLSKKPVSEPSTKQDKKKTLTKKTFEDVCICGKLPMVIPMPPATDYAARSAPQRQQPTQAPLRAPRAYSPQFDRPPQQQFTPSMMPPMSPMQPSSMFHTPMALRQSVIPYEPSVPSAKEERVASIKKLVELENRLLVKQEHTKQKINVLQSTVDKFKRELELERQKNSDLINRYTNQSKTVANMKVEMDIVKRESFEDKRKLQHLNSTLKNILEYPRKVSYSSKPQVMLRPTTIPHFHTELTVVREDDNKFKHSCIMRTKPMCPCQMVDKSSDSFEIDE